MFVLNTIYIKSIYSPSPNLERDFWLFKLDKMRVGYMRSQAESVIVVF